MEREILLIGAGVIFATLLLTQSSAVAESFANILNEGNSTIRIRIAVRGWPSCRKNDRDFHQNPLESFQ